MRAPTRVMCWQKGINGPERTEHCRQTSIFVPTRKVLACRGSGQGNKKARTRRKARSAEQFPLQVAAFVTSDHDGKVQLNEIAFSIRICWANLGCRHQEAERNKIGFCRSQHVCTQRRNQLPNGAPACLDTSATKLDPSRSCQVIAWAK